MVTTTDNERRKAYKRLWYQKKKANEAGDIYAVRLYEDQMDHIRKIKHNPKARKQQLIKQAKHRASVYKRKSQDGYFRATSRRYRKRHRKLCLKRDREWRRNLTPQKRAKRLAYHRKYYHNHREIINKRALIYAHHNKEHARRNSRRYYYNHKTEKLDKQ